MINDFFDGLKAYGRAFSIISKYGLWGYAFIPAIITLILTGIIGFSAYSFSDDFGHLLVSWWSWDWGSEMIESVGTWLGGIIIGIIGILSLKYIVLIVVAPFMSLLSEKVEAKITGKKSNAKFSLSKAFRDILRGLRLSLRNIIRELFFTFILLLAGLIPVAGWITPFLIFIVQSYYAGFGNTDFTMERHFSVRQSVNFARQHRGLMIGNGTVFMLLLMTGIGFLIAPPLATVAATIESIERLDVAGYIQSEPESFV